jgi:hypothetical protein
MGMGLERRQHLSFSLSSASTHKKAPAFRRELSSSVDLNFRLIPDQPIAGA